MFKFGFSSSDNEHDDEKETNIKDWYAAKEINVNVDKLDLHDFDALDFVSSHFSIKYISSTNVIKHLKKSNTVSNCILRADTDHSDLVTAEYEGGLKIWECTSDLVKYFDENSVSFANKSVLDLGCGAGIIGLYALLKGSSVDFQDYNKEVIECTTIPNVLLNVDRNERDAKCNSCKFYCGDWKSFINLTTSKYDYILTSETIYNPENYQKLIDVFSELLAENGTIYLAAKTYYFGVGGGIRQFEELLQRSQIFSTTICWKNSEGVQREILKICKI